MKYFLFVIIILFSACSSKVVISEADIKMGIFYAKDDFRPFTGKCLVVFNDTNIVKDEFTYKNGILEGETISWYKNGQMRRRGNYSNGKLNSRWEFWDENGNKLVDAVYVKDMLNGPYMSYFSDGSIKEKGQYINDKRTGDWVVNQVSTTFITNDTQRK